MKSQAQASDLERRKQVKLRLRVDLSITEQRYEGRNFWVVKDPVSLRYYRFKEQEHYLLELMDGGHTLEEAQKKFESNFRPDRLTLEDLEQFGQQLLKAGLVHNETPKAGQLLFEQLSKRRKQKRIQMFTNILYVKIPIFDPERVLERMLPWTRFIFTGWFATLSGLFMLTALILVMTNFAMFRDKLPSFHEFFSLKTVFYLWFALGVVKIIHEFGHGLSCKAFGGEVHEMGFLLLCLSPAMYCNVSDAWTLPNKWKRITISGAGIYVELMIAAIATWVWWYTPGYPFLNYMALSLMFVCSVNTIMFNGNPLMRFDGYYVLSDLLEIPNLREKANRYLQRTVMNRCLGIEVQPEPYMALWRRSLFLFYAIASYCYRWIITFSILFFLSNFLGPKLRILSQMLALFAAGTMIVWPLVRLFKGLKKRGRLPDMKALNTSISAVALAAVILVFFFVPLPVSRIRQTGVVQVQPTAAAKVSVKVTGVLKKILVKEGEHVNAGQELAVFANPEKTIEVTGYASTLSIENYVVNVYRRQENLAQRNRAAADTFHQAWLNAKSNRAQAKTKWQSESDLLKELTLRAPRSGRVMGLPRPNEVNKLWKEEESPPFCRVGDPTQLRVLLPVTPDDYDILRENLLRSAQNNTVLGVTIRVLGRDMHTWKGRITLADLPKSVAKEVPLELSNKGGGPLALKPNPQKENKLIPQEQVYLVPIEIQYPDRAIVPGAFAQVKIHCEHRSVAWWLWRTISKTFDLGLL